MAPSFKAWSERRLPVAGLLLDTKNPRVPLAATEPNQRDLIEELVEHDHVYELAKDIAASGFDPLESLIGLAKDGKTIILEGNRRLAALKLLQNPDLAPPSYHRRFKQLVGKYPDSSESSVRVLLAPTREDAAPLILRKHTTIQIERWSPLMQARFYRSLTQSGVPLDELARRYGVTAGEIREFLRIDTMYELARSMELPATIATRVDDPRDFPASVLQRLLEMSAFHDFLGLKFDANGGISSTAAPADFRKAFSRVLTDIAEGRIDTRSLNTVKEADAYIKRHWAQVTPDKKNRTFSKAELMGERRAEAVTDPPTAAPTRRQRATTTKVIPPTIRCTIDDDRAREVFKELKRLSPDTFPNAHAVLLRLLLEFGVTYYVTKTGQMARLLEKAKEKQKGPDWSPTLRQMLKPMLEDPEVKIRPLARKGVIALLNEDQRAPLSVMTLDGFIHNSFEWPDEKKIRRLWKVLEDVLVLVLEEPVDDGTAPTGVSA